MAERINKMTHPDVSHDEEERLFREKAEIWQREALAVIGTPEFEKQLHASNPELDFVRRAGSPRYE